MRTLLKNACFNGKVIFARSRNLLVHGIWILFTISHLYYETSLIGIWQLNFFQMDRHQTLFMSHHVTHPHLGLVCFIESTCCHGSKEGLNDPYTKSPIFPTSVEPTLVMGWTNVFYVFSVNGKRRRDAVQSGTIFSYSAIDGISQIATQHLSTIYTNKQLWL